jgi:hypothetical protein
MAKKNVKRFDVEDDFTPDELELEGEYEETFDENEDDFDIDVDVNFDDEDEDSADFDEDDEDEDSADFDEDDEDEDSADFDEDDGDDSFHSGIDEEEAASFFDEVDEDVDDLLFIKRTNRKPKLAEGIFSGTIGKPKGERVFPEKFGEKPWTKVTIPFICKNPKSGEAVTVNFFASKSIGENSRLYPILKGIIGSVPDDGFSLKELEGKKVYVKIEHWVSGNGDIWENVVSAKPRR